MWDMCGVRQAAFLVPLAGTPFKAFFLADERDVRSLVGTGV